MNYSKLPLFFLISYRKNVSELFREIIVSVCLGPESDELSQSIIKGQAVSELCLKDESSIFYPEGMLMIGRIFPGSI